jgi:hypothetical protein
MPKTSLVLIRIAPLKEPCIYADPNIIGVKNRMGACNAPSRPVELKLHIYFKGVFSRLNFRAVIT